MPRIFLYNPTCEMATRNMSVSYQPPEQLSEFERNIASILMFLADKGDYVVAGEPDAQLITFWQSRGKAIPTFCDTARTAQLIASGCELQAWGESPQLFHSLLLTEQLHAFGAARRKLFSRLTSVAIETAIARQPLPEYARIGTLPTIITDAKILESITANEPRALKSLWSASGRGVVLVRKAQHVAPAVVWARGILRRDGAIVSEPFLRRVAEFSLLFVKRADGSVEYLGKNVFRTDVAGRFGAEVIDNDYFTEKVRQWNIPADWEAAVVPLIADAIESCSDIASYAGPIGLDAMFYADGDTVKLRCCTEANLRLSMGNVNMSVARYFSRTATAEWKIEQFATPAEWQEFCRRMEREHPARCDANGLIKSGFFRLTGIGCGERFGAYGFAVDANR